jgi:sugar phosphate isomerase/epimerase
MTALTINRRSLLAAGLGFAALSAAPAFGAAEPFFKRHNLKLGLQIYALGNNVLHDLDGTFAKVKAAGYGAVEIFQFATFDAVKLNTQLARWGLTCPSAQSDLGPEVDLSKLADGLHTVGADTCAFTALMPQILDEPFSWTSAEQRQNLSQRTAADWRRAADFLNEKGAALKQRGIKLAYHNHNFEFAPVGDTCGQDLLIKYTEPDAVYFQLDIGWAAAAGKDPAAVFSKDKGRYWSAHMKDIKASTPINYIFNMDNAVVGQGKLNWPKILAAAYHAGVRRYFVEHEDPNRTPEAIKASREFLSQVVA